MPNWLSWGLAMLGAIGGLGGVITAVGALAKLRAEQEQIEADASEQITKTALSLIDPLKKQIEELTERVRVLEKELREWKMGARLLINQIVELGEVPVWWPAEGSARE